MSDEPQPLKRRPPAYRRTPDQVAQEARQIASRMDHERHHHDGVCGWCEEDWPCWPQRCGRIMELLANEVHRLGVKAGEIA